MKRLLGFLKLKWFPISFVLILLLTLFSRFYRVTSSPPSLYWEEMALGYDAYSVLKTGKDHLGNSPSIIAFESYGDYKPALYFYLLLPSLAVFGLNEFSVRLPTILAGVGIVVGVGLIARMLITLLDQEQLSFPKRKLAQLVQCLAMLVTTLSPWAILFSRAAWESNVATCFIVWGVGTCLWAIQNEARNVQTPNKLKKLFYSSSLFLELGLIFFGLAMYTYHATRFIGPLLALFLFSVAFSRKLQWPIKFEKEKKRIGRYFLIGCGFLVVLAPLLISLGDNTIQQRLAETSIFADGHVVRESNQARAQANYTLWSKIFFHRDVLYFKEFSENYLKHFNFQFLFLTGDANLRHSVQYFGQLYLFESILILIGLGFVFRQRKILFWFLIFWLLIGVIPAALTDAAPHALRTLAIMPVYMLFITFGIMEVVFFWPGKLKRLPQQASRILPAAVVIGCYMIFFGSFWHFYQTVYPKLYSGAWQYGYRQIVADINQRKNNYLNVYFLRSMDRPAMAYWFFSQTDPHLVQPINKLLQKDQGEELQFENIHFVNFMNNAGPGLVAAPVESLELARTFGAKAKDIHEIKDPAGKTIWLVFQLE